MKTLINILKYLWLLPLILIAIFLLLILSGSYLGKYRNKNLIYTSKRILSLSLGEYIFVNPSYDKIDLYHEYGHSILSIYLGPLYLFIIGIPSVLHFWVRRLFRKFGITWNYYSFYTELWADKLGGVDHLIRLKPRIKEYIFKNLF